MAVKYVITTSIFLPVIAFYLQQFKNSNYPWSGRLFKAMARFEFTSDAVNNWTKETKYGTYLKPCHMTQLGVVCKFLLHRGSVVVMQSYSRKT